MFRIRQFNAPSAELGKAAEILPWILNTGAPISMGRQRHTVSVWVSNPERLRVQIPPCPSLSPGRRSGLSSKYTPGQSLSGELIRALRWAGALQRNTRPGVAPYRDSLWAQLILWANSFIGAPAYGSASENARKQTGVVSRKACAPSSLKKRAAAHYRNRALRPSQSVPVTPRGFFVCPQAASLS